MDETSWRGADLPVAAVPVAVGVAALLAWATSVLARGLDQPAPTPGVATTPLELGATERVAWVWTATSRWALPVVAACAGIGLAGAALTPSGAVVALVVVGVAMAAFTSVRVSVGAAGVRVAYGRLGWPTTRIPIEEIRRASAVHVRPSSWGGWGYRGSLRLFRHAAVVLRSGEGLRLDLDADRVFLVTVDDPGTGAGLLNEELRRSGRRDGS